MNFIKCILGKVKEGKVKSSSGNKLIADYERRVEALKKNGMGEEAAAKAANDILQREASVIEQRQRNQALAAKKQIEIGKEIDASKKPAAYARDLYQRTAFRAESIMTQTKAFIDQLAEKNGVDVKNITPDKILNGVRSLLGDKVDDADAVGLGKIMTQTFDRLHEQYKNAGGIIGKLPNYFPQIHSKDKILAAKVSKEAWIQETLPLLNRERIIDDMTGLPMETQRLVEAMGSIYDDIITSGRASMAKAEGPSVGRGSDVDMRQAQSRFLHFKDAESWLSYNEKYGVGNDGLGKVFGNHLKNMSRDIALLEMMGPRPHAMARYIDWKMDVSGQVSQAKRHWVNAEYRVLSSKFEIGDVDGALWKIFVGTHGWLRSAKLGSAPISALSDSFYLMATAKINGLDALKVAGSYAKNMIPGDTIDKAIAKRTGVLADAIMGNMVQDARMFGDALDASGKFSKLGETLSNMTHKWSGLKHMTEVAQTSIVGEALSTIGEHINLKTKWADLPDDLRVNLERFKFSERDWADLQKFEVPDMDGYKPLITSDLRTDESFVGKLKEQFADAAEQRMMSRIEDIDRRKQTLDRFVDLKDRLYEINTSQDKAKVINRDVSRIERRLEKLRAQRDDYRRGVQQGLSKEERISRTREYGVELDSEKQKLRRAESELTSAEREQIIAQRDLERAREAYKRQFGKYQDEVKFGPGDEARAGQRARSRANARPVNELAKKVDDLNSRIDGLKSEIETFKDSIDDLKTKRDALSGGEENTVTKIKEAEAELSAKNNELREIANKQDSLRRELKSALKNRKELAGTPAETLDQMIREMDEGVRRAEQFDVGADTDEFLKMSALNRTKELSDKIDDWVMSLRQMTTNEPLLATRALTTGAVLGSDAGGPATFSRYVGATLGLFKSFPITVILSHLLPAVERARVQRKFDHLAMVTVGTTILGALSIQLRQMVQGKTPKDMDTKEFALAAFLQGGGLGLFGDFFLGDYSRTDRTPIGTATGPMFGLFDDIMKATKGNLDRWVKDEDGEISGVAGDIGGDLFRVMRRNLPLSTLWYGRLALERLVLDNLERLVDPSFDRRMTKFERKIKKETGQEFWWKPGDAAPDF